MRILLTNADGVNATGLKVLERTADCYRAVTPLHLNLTHAPSLGRHSGPDA